MQSDMDYFKFVILSLLFLLLAFNRDLAMIYILMLLGDWFWYKSDTFISFPLERNSQNRLQVIVESLIAYGAFLGITSITLSVFAPQTLAVATTQIQSIFQLLATSTPVLQGSKILTLVGWGILIPIIETSFFNGRLLEGLADFGGRRVGTKIPMDSLKNVKTWVVIFVVAALFTLFHITSKELANIPLMITFIFSVVSSILVIRHQELKGAILIHVLSNSLVIIASFGLI